MKINSEDKYMKIKKIGMVLMTAALFSGLACIAETAQVAGGSLGMPLTREGGTARAMSMGSAVVGVPQDSSSLFWNPAGLGTIECMELGLHHNNGLGESIHETAVIGMPIGILGGLAASINYVDNGIFEGRDSVGNVTDNYTAGDLSVNLGWGKKLFSGISAGMAVKYNRQALANKVYSAYAMDLGLLWNPISRLNLGLAYSNLGTDVATSLLDSGWRVGASYGVNDSLLLALSSELKPDGFDRLQMGVEGLINSIIALRAGYVYNFTASKLDSTSGITAGMGVRILKNIMFDYAYLSFGELGGSHRVSLTYKFWCPNKAIEEQAKRIAEIKPVPIITGISPTLGPVTGKTMVVITGSGFKNITETNGVKFGGVNAMNYTVDSDTQITAVSPAHAAGIVNIVVISTVGASSTVLEDSYTYYIPAPMISGINPTFGPAAGGTTVVITGSGFNGITGVAGIKFATLNATSYTVDSDTQITAVSPAHAAGTINIVATSPVGASPIVPEDFYTYSAPPAPKVQPTVIILEKLILFEDTHFEFDSSTLTKDGARIVVENTQVLKDNPVAKIRIAGYASASGTEEYNQKLSERRASAIKEILVKVGGISQDRITTIGYGETRPAMFEPIPAHIDSMEAQANMRVLFEIIVK